MSPFKRNKKAFLSERCKEIEKTSRMGNTRDLFKKIRDINRTFHGKMGTIKNKNGKDLTEAEDTKKNYCLVTLISHATKVILKIFESRFRQYVN